MMTHEEVVECGPDPGCHGRDDVKRGQVWNGDVVVRQEGWNRVPDQHDGDGWKKEKGWINCSAAVEGNLGHGAIQYTEGD